MEAFFKGDKVTLRAVRTSDYEDYYLKTNNGDTESTRNSDRMVFPVGDEARKDRIDKLTRLNPYNDEYTLIIENEDKVPVGNINSHSCNRVDGVFSYGLGILADYRNKGYASDAIKILLRYFFEELDYKKAEVSVYEFNEASLALHDYLGFVREGVKRQNHFAKGKRWDTIIFGLLREEF